VLAAVGAALSYCSSFEGAVDGPDAAVNEGGSSVDSEAATVDAAVAVDAATPIEAGPHLIRCGAETCNVATEVCCVYHTSLGVRRTECIAGNAGDCVPDVDAGEMFDVATQCDEQSDCAAGLVCCHQYPTNPASMRCSSHAKDARCVQPESCQPCAIDAGTGRVACDPAAKQCPTGFRCDGLVATTFLIAPGYCVP
jgi:hypothetical protein